MDSKTASFSDVVANDLQERFRKGYLDGVSAAGFVGRVLARARRDVVKPILARS